MLKVGELVMVVVGTVSVAGPLVTCSVLAPLAPIVSEGEDWALAGGQVERGIAADERGWKLEGVK